ncbi:uncharacterized protein LOC126743057 isoform X7 [Anthonomus grandis grandis]|uniref:uncharacterized protein LOC126743057 isoform X7 n=1 Tax=Anthonomus grandis grandis TaxID=2921223 RepID=UPI002166B8E2|nr:uncharacterized protein LOC126743057 isoform X7 [Anthonomus grandis grandis]
MFRFPVKLKDICNQWILNSGNAKLTGVPVESLRGKYICKNHFNNEDFRTENQKYLKSNAVPQNYSAFFSSPFASDSEKTLKPLRADLYTSGMMTMPEQHMQDASSSIELKYSDIVKEEMLSIMSEQHMQDASSSVELKYSDIVKEEMLSDETDSQQVDEVQENNIQDQEKHPEYETITKKRSVSLIEEDECDLIGKCVAAKLRRLDPIDALIAEKRINDILFDFQLKSLSRSGSQLRIPDDL